MRNEAGSTLFFRFSLHFIALDQQLFKSNRQLVQAAAKKVNIQLVNDEIF